MVADSYFEDKLSILFSDNFTNDSAPNQKYMLLYVVQWYFK